MSFLRYAKNTDTTQAAIVDGLRKLGFKVYIIGLPCDLLVYKHKWWTLECKSPRNKSGDPKMDKRRVAQAKFCADTNTPYVTTLEQALEHLK